MSRSLDLILDTSRQGIALGIYAEGNIICEKYEPDCRGENLGRLLDSSLSFAEVTLEEIKRVLVTLGPGSFTGLRTGIAFCEGLCFSGSRTLYGVSTLAALRSLSPEDNTAVILRARPDYWYLGLREEEFFVSTEETLEKIAADLPKVFVCDSSAASDASLLDFATQNNIQIIVAKGPEIQPFSLFFDRIKPSLTQKANYIQPSYFERAK